MNKIAYLFHGHSRTWNQCHKAFFQNIYSKLPGDIFIHTWDTVNSLYASYWNGGHDYKKFEGEYFKIASQLPDFQSIYNTYKPKIFIIEPNRDPDFNIMHNLHAESINIKPAHLGTKNMLYQSKKLFDIANNYQQYDYFFSTRLDLLYTNEITEEEKNQLFQPNILSCPHQTSDIWMFGDKNSMEIKTNYYSYIDEYWFKKKCDFHLYPYESALFEYLKDNKVKDRVSSIKSEFVRLPL